MPARPRAGEQYLSITIISKSYLLIRCLAKLTHNLSSQSAVFRVLVDKALQALAGHLAHLVAQ